MKKADDRYVENVSRLKFDPNHLTEAFYQDPFPTYAALQSEDPVYRCPDGSYFLTRYEDLLTVYQNAKRFSSDKRAIFKPKFGDSFLYQHHTTSLVFNDAPLHTRVRKIITNALTRGTVEKMQHNVRELVNGLLARMQTLSRIDAIEDYAALIPIEVIGNLLRIPHSDRKPLRGWSLAILGALEPSISAEVLNQGNQAVEEFLAYLTDLIRERRKNPSDEEDDLLSRLIQGLPNGETLSELELLHNCIFILNAGHETTTNIIGNGIYTFIQHPESLQEILQHPELMASAVEELLRYESPNQLGNRELTEPTQIRGVPMPAGTQLTLCIGAANRDPNVFPQPQQFDIHRKPNKHLAFASGPHLCAGGHVARMEARIALEEFFRCNAQMHLTDAPVRSRRARFRGFLNLPLATI